LLDSPGSMVPARRVFILLYAASGAAALVYEVTWTRLLTLQLGHTVAAVSTVLAAFMGGLALGAWVAGRRGVSSLRAYAILELVVAAIALLLPLALAASVPLLAWSYADGTAPARFTIVRVGLSMILVGVPAAAMGATFPIAATWFAAGARDGSAAAALYAANTAGAASGAIAAGFFLIPAIGLRATTWVGVALNIVAAAGAFYLASQPSSNAELAMAAKPDSAKPRKTDKRGAKKDSLRALRAWRSHAPAPGLACTAVAISGFAALMYEVAWTRLLALVIGPTTYAFATMAAAFISGLALGSALGSRLANWTTRPAVWLSMMLVAAAIAASAGAYITATRMPLVVAAQVADPNAAFAQVVVRQALGTALLLLPMTLALGATFPLALAVAAGGTSSAGADAARVYTANTLGAIAGSLAAGFVFIPAVGLRSTFQTAAIAAALGGAACLAAALRAALVPQSHSGTGPRSHSGIARGPTRALVVPAIVGLASVAAIVALPGWDRELLASGAYKYAPYLGSDNLETVLRAGDLEYYKEGAAATVSVRRLTGTTSMAIDGKIDASNAGDMLTQRLLGLLPVLIHGNAQEVAVIGLGSGVTVGSALAAGTVRRADVIEISPEVVEASRFFDRESGEALRNPAVRLIVGDGRSHLLLTPQHYDVIVSEPSNPWMSGVAALFTREFFEAARARLKPDGLLCQWAHTYDISATDLKSIVATFRSVFPEGTMWLVGEGDLLLIGAAGRSIADRLDRIAAGVRNAATAAALSSVGIEPSSAAFDLLSLYAGGPRELERYGDGGLIQTDDHAVLEYSAPRSIYGRTTTDNAQTIRGLGGDRPATVRAALEKGTDADWTSRGRMELRAEAHALAFDAFRRAVGLNTRNADALAGLSDAAAGARKQDEVRDFLRGIAAREAGNAPVRVELSRVLAAGGDFQGAVDMATEALRLTPDDPRAGEQLASIVADAGDADRLQPLAESLAARFPDRPEPKYYVATALFLRGRTEDALTAVRQVTDGHPEHARAQNLLGAACATLKRRECAQAAFEASVRASPRDPSTYVNLGQFALETANAGAAARYFSEALSIDPELQTARDGLARARSALSSAAR
jgi:spermidine synthase